MKVRPFFVVLAVIAIALLVASSVFTRYNPSQHIGPVFAWSAPRTSTVSMELGHVRSWSIPKVKRLRIAFSADSPVDLAVLSGRVEAAESLKTDAGICHVYAELKDTFECDTSAEFESTLFIVDSRSPEMSAARTGIGVATRDANTLNAIKPITVTLAISGFECVRNCPTP